jgi:hypothetical protein
MGVTVTFTVPDPEVAKAILETNPKEKIARRENKNILVNFII